MKSIDTITLLLLCIFAGTYSNAQTMNIPEDLSGEIWTISNSNSYNNGFGETITYQFFGSHTFKVYYRYEGGELLEITAKGIYKFDKQANRIVFIVKNIDNKTQTNTGALKIKLSCSYAIIKKENDSTYIIQKFISRDEDRNGKRITTKEVFPIQKMIRKKEKQQQKIDKLLQRLNSIGLENLDSWGRDELDIYERPYAHPTLRPNDSIAARIDSFKYQLYQLGATVIWNWNEKKEGYELETNQHLIARRAFVEVYVAKTVYQSTKLPNEYFLKFTIKNTCKENIGYNLSHKENSILYANQWGKYSQPYRGVIDERRIVFENKNLTPIIHQFKDGLLQTIKPNKQIDYYINLDGSNDELVLDDKSGFFIVTIDGQMKFTDGKTVELISLENAKDEVRAIVFPMPVKIDAIPEKQMIFVDKVMNEHRH